MKKNLVGMMLIAVIQCFASDLATASDQTTVVMKPEAVFTPKGFNNNNNVQVIISGSFRSFCFKVAPVKFRVDKSKFKIYIQNEAYVTPGCADALLFIPYMSVVNVGAIPVGNYEVLTMDKNGTYAKQDSFPVTQAMVSGQGSDDFLYAPITEASVEFFPGQSGPTLTLKGVFTNTCMSLGNIQANLREGNVFEVLPFAKMGTTDCKNQATAFTTSVMLNDFPKDRTLIHIRSMNGQSINRVITSVDRIPHF